MEDSRIIKTEDFEGATISVMAPGASAKDVKVNVDLEERKIYIKVGEPSVSQPVKDTVELAFETSVDVSSRYDLRSTEFKVQNGMITLIVGISEERVMSIEPSKLRKSRQDAGENGNKENPDGL